MTRLHKFLQVTASLALLLLGVQDSRAEDKPFVHPGMLHSREDIEFVRGRIASGEEPWKKAWEKLQKNEYASLKYEAKPTADVVQGSFGNPDIGGGQMIRDANAAYSHALQWVLAGNKENAAKAIEIIGAYSSTLKSIGGSNQKILSAWSMCKFANAAELLVHGTAPDGSRSGWKKEDVESFKKMTMEIFYQQLKEFQPTYNGNWDAQIMNSLMCIGIFFDDHEKFNRGIEHYLNGKSKGAIGSYIFDNGQCQETTRDQTHVQEGLGAMLSLCEIAWKQGRDLYGAMDNRLLLGLEYTARFNTELDWKPEFQGRIIYKPDQGRGKFQPMWELGYLHYAVRKGLPMPYTKTVLEKVRPEGMSIVTPEIWGTLMFYRTAEVKK